MTEAEPLIMIPSEWTEWLSKLSREENAAWVVLGAGAFFLGIAIKGLWTGSIRVPFTPSGFDSWLFFTTTDSDHHDRDTDGFQFWLTLIFLAVIGVLGIIYSMKMFGIWQPLFS